MTYNVFGGTLSLTQSINQFIFSRLSAPKKTTWMDRSLYCQTPTLITYLLRITSSSALCQASEGCSITPAP